MLNELRLFSDINVPEFSWPKIRASYNDHADEVFGNPTDINTAIFTEDSDAFFDWCDTNDDQEVSLWESASCGSKSAFWGPKGESAASWTDMFTFGTEIAYDFVQILLKYWGNIDEDGSRSLNRDEFRVSYAKFSLLAAHVEMDILDSDNDGVLQGNELKTFTTLSIRGANVVLPGKLKTYKRPFELSEWNLKANISDCRALKIIEIDTKVEPISLGTNRENQLLVFAWAFG